MKELNEYQAAAMRTRSADAEPKDMAMLNAALGLAGESGEFCDLLKKQLFHGHPLTEELRMKYVKEAGDILWYLALAAYALDTDLETIARLNINKLTIRYPNNFQPHRSINKDESKE